jgi:hypothetical protein
LSPYRDGTRGAIEKQNGLVDEITAEDGFVGESDHSSEPTIPAEIHSCSMDRRALPATAHTGDCDVVHTGKPELPDDPEGHQRAVSSGIHEHWQHHRVVARRSRDPDWNERGGRIEGRVVAVARRHVLDRLGERIRAVGSSAWTRGMYTLRFPNRLNTRVANASKSRA